MQSCHVLVAMYVYLLQFSSNCIYNVQMALDYISKMDLFYHRKEWVSAIKRVILSLKREEEEFDHLTPEVLTLITPKSDRQKPSQKVFNINIDCHVTVNPVYGGL